jgi:hypothetical protein
MVVLVRRTVKQKLSPSLRNNFGHIKLPRDLSLTTEVAYKVRPIAIYRTMQKSILNNHLTISRLRHYVTASTRLHITPWKSLFKKSRRESGDRMKKAVIMSSVSSISKKVR